MNKKALGSRLFASLGFFLAVSPLFALLGALLSPARCALWLALPALAVLLAFFVRLIPQRRRVLALITAEALLTGCALLLGAREGRLLLSLLPAAAGAAALMVHLSALCRLPGEEYPGAVWGVGALAQLAARLLTRVALLAPAKGALLWLCPMYFAYLFFALNESALLSGMGGDRAPSAAMRLRNRLRAGGAYLLMLILANLSLIRGWLEALFALIKRGAAALLLFLLSRPEEAAPISDASAPGEMDLSLLAGESAPPSALAEFLERAIRIAALAIALAAACAALWFLCKKLKKLIGRLLISLRAYAGRIGGAYEDTVESLLDWGEVKSALNARVERVRRARQARVPWDKLDARQRVRRAYQLLRCRRNAPDSRTARELLTGGALSVPKQAAPRMADIYDKARYSTLPIDADEARFMREQIKG